MMPSIKSPRARLLSALASFAVCWACAAGWAAPGDPRPTLENFFQNPAISQATLSPNGKHLAMLVQQKNGRMQLAVTAVDQLVPKLVAGFADVDIYGFEWVNSDRLVLHVFDLLTPPGEVRYGPGLYAVNRDGSDMTLLIVRPHAKGYSRLARNILGANHAFLSVDPRQDTNDVFVRLYDTFTPYHAIGLRRLNTLTGESKIIDGPERAQSWLIDPGGTPRIAVANSGGEVRIHYLDPSTGQWQKLAQFPEFSTEGFTPEAFGPNGTLYVTAALQRDKTAIYAYDLAAKRLNPEPVLAHKDYDIKGAFVTGADGVRGVRYEADAPATYWFDPRAQSLQKTVDTLLPGTENRLQLAPRGRNAVIRSASDTQPARFLLYDEESGKLTLIGDAMPGVNARQMAQTDMVRYKARDGLEIPAYLTLPQGSSGKNLPLVVLVHGGPWARDSWLWHADVQFLASRGYAVLRPEFRGSVGFGSQHFRAGWKQWGLKMQDDVADGTQWAVAQGIADPKRICIAGASYGGYAVLMGLANNPDLYRCGVDWVGVTDIDLLFSVNWSDTSEEFKQYGMKLLVGDPDKDVAQFRATSPIEQAARIGQPLLLAYGVVDRRVPIVHGNKFRDAVKAHNPHVEWITYPEEGHGWTQVPNRVDFWIRVEQFLDRNIGQGTGAGAAGQASR
jgi:dipeptidyl aminopeptidase/acylaminoacyl peptidase